MGKVNYNYWLDLICTEKVWDEEWMYMLSHNKYLKAALAKEASQTSRDEEFIYAFEKLVDTESL